MAVNSFDFFFTTLPLGTTFYVRVSVDGGAYGVTQQFITSSSLGFSFIDLVNDSVNGPQGVGRAIHPITETNVYIHPRRVPGVSQYTVEISDTSVFGAGSVSQTRVGPTHSKLHYQFTGLPNSTKIYVRVMTDLDGVFGRVKYFITKDAFIPRPSPGGGSNPASDFSLNTTYSAYPNPFTHDFYTKVDSDVDESLTVRITDLRGQVVFESSDYMTNENIKLGSTLKKGMYLIQLKHEDTFQLMKVIKK